MSGVEGHNTLGEGERYHLFLRAVFSKILLDQPDMDADYALGAVVKPVNDAAGPKGIVLCPLLFGILPRLPI